MNCQYSPQALAPVQISATVIIPAGSIARIESIAYPSQEIAEDKPVSRIYYHFNGSIANTESFYPLHQLAKAWQEALR